MANAGILGDSLEGTIPQNEESFLDNRYREFIYNFRNFYFVSCWHMTEEAKPAMWNDFLIENPLEGNVRTF